MSIFDQQRLTDETFKLDVERMRQGWYTDKYFTNLANMLAALARQGYTYQGRIYQLQPGAPPAEVGSGDLEVEMQWFSRRLGQTVVVGVDKALVMLKHCTGYWEEGQFVNTADKLSVWAVHDGAIVASDGDPLNILPVLRVRGRYRDFGILETPTLGSLARSSRVATNVYETLTAAHGKPVLFFAARFDMHEAQAADGYAYSIAVQRYNWDHASAIGPFVSTDAQGDWWGGTGGGTVAHAAIACFLGDTAEAMLNFAATMPANIARIALVDFNNDCVADSLATCQAMFTRYRELVDADQESEANHYQLYGVRLDTSSSMRDRSVLPLGDTQLDLGVTPRLVFNVRQALDTAWESWGVPAKWRQRAHDFCTSVKIVVSGGFNPEKIRRFEKLGVPVDIYAVGSSMMDNHGPTVTDFTADVVRIRLHGEWMDMAKVGRRACDNPQLIQVW